MDDIARFLAEHLPWRALPPARVCDLAARLQIEYFPRGARLASAGDGPVDHLWVLRSGSVDLLAPADGAWLDRRGEGDPLGADAWLAGGAPSADIVAREDVLAYRLPRESLEALGDLEPLRRLLAARPGDRLREAVAGAGEGPGGRLDASAGDLVTRPPVGCPPETPVAEAARQMAQAGVSSLLVLGDPPGIVTDRDFRDRVVAAGGDPAAPVSSIQSAPLFTVAADALLAEALATMVDRGVHHLPVERGGRLVGVLSDSDVLRRLSGSPLLLRRVLDRAGTDAEREAWVAQAGAALEAPGMEGLRASAAGHVASLLADALVRQVVAGSLADRPPAPGAWCWMALGAAGRREAPWPPPRSGLVAFDGAAGEPLSHWAGDLAADVEARLARSGLPRGDEGASTASAAPADLLTAATVGGGSLDRFCAVMDGRPVAGPLDAAPFRRALAAAALRAGAARRLAARAGLNPARGLFRGCVLEADGHCTEGLDLVRRWLDPLADLGRLAALLARVESLSTPARLRDAAERGVLDAGLARDLCAAWEWAAALRARLARGRGPAVVRPLDLSPGDRQRASDVFDTLAAGRAALQAAAAGEGPWRG